MILNGTTTQKPIFGVSLRSNFETLRVVKYFKASLHDHCYMFCHLICYIFTIEPKMSIKRKHKFMSLIILLKPFHGSISHKSGTLMTHEPDSSTFALEERLDFKKVMKHALETLRIACLFLPLDHLRDSKFFRKTNCKIKASKNFWLSC